MLSTDNHHAIRHITVADLPAIAGAQNTAGIAAFLVTDALRAAGFESDQVTVIPTVTADSNLRCWRSP